MKLFRIFVQDRDHGKFSCLTEVKALDTRAALLKFKGRDLPKLKAIAWPPDNRGKGWVFRWT